MIPAHTLNEAIEAYNSKVGHNIAFPLALEAALEVAAWHIWEKASDSVWDAALEGERIPPNPYSREGSTGGVTGLNYMRLWHESLAREDKAEQELIRLATLAAQAKGRAERAEVKARGWRKRAEQWAEELDQAEGAR